MICGHRNGLGVQTMAKETSDKLVQSVPRPCCEFPRVGVEGLGGCRNLGRGENPCQQLTSTAWHGALPSFAEVEAGGPVGAGTRRPSAVLQISLQPMDKTPCRKAFGIASASPSQLRREGEGRSFSPGALNVNTVLFRLSCWPAG